MVNRSRPVDGVLLQQRLEAHLEDVRLPGVQRLDPIGVDVDADDLVAELGHAGGMRRPQVVGADDTHPQSHAHDFATVVAHGLGVEHQLGQPSVIHRLRLGQSADLPDSPHASATCREAVLSAADRMRIEVARPADWAYPLTSRTASVTSPRPRACGWAQ